SINPQSCLILRSNQRANFPTLGVNNVNCPETAGAHMNIHSLTPYLEAFDMPASLAFYRDILGFAVIINSGETPETPGLCMLQDGARTRMPTPGYDPDGKRPPAPAPARVKAHRDTALYFSSKNADAIYAQLKAKQWPADPPVTQPY